MYSTVQYSSQLCSILYFTVQQPAIRQKLLAKIELNTQVYINFQFEEGINQLEIRDFEGQIDKGLGKIYQKILVPTGVFVKYLKKCSLQSFLQIFYFTQASLHQYIDFSKDTSNQGMKQKYTNHTEMRMKKLQIEFYIPVLKCLNSI